jgi:hypothetical protein
VLQIINAEDGELIKRQRTATKTQVFASPLLAGDYLYMPFQDVGISVMKADDDCQQVAVNSLGDEAPLMASITPDGNRFFFRTDRYLYCVGGEARKTDVLEWAEPDDKQLVETIETCNIEAEKGWSRRYLGFLTKNYEQTTRFLLMPYRSVITSGQTRQGEEIVVAEKPKFDVLREKLEALRWEQLQAPANEAATFNPRFEALEVETNKLCNDVRILIKKLFSEEQMKQHMADAAEGKAHLAPGKRD